MDKRLALKVKVKSLAAEAKIIRKEEGKVKGNKKVWLADHRKGIVRYEARHSLLAYGYLRGKKYKQIESKAESKPDWKKVRKMVETYGSPMDFSIYPLLQPESQGELSKRLKEFDNWTKEQ